MDEQRREHLAERARQAWKRATELAERVDRLRAGEPPNERDVTRAAEAAQEAEAHAERSRRHANQQLRRSASTHRAAAELLAAAGRQTEARRHREAAAKDDAAAEAGMTAATDDGSRRSVAEHRSERSAKQRRTR
jgi:hypothetical protein